jgi:diapolycopene oxygenase
MSNKKVIVIGSGLGGLSAAISLKQSGYDVEVFEKNAQIGGKLNVLKQQGYTLDLGPSILTLPHIFERLFERSGKRMSDYFSLRALRPLEKPRFQSARACFQQRTFTTDGRRAVALERPGF